MVSSEKVQDADIELGQQLDGDGATAAVVPEPVGADGVGDGDRLRKRSTRVNRKALTLRWKDVKFSVKLKGGTEREILKGISGHAKAGQLLAIMGSTCAGKTSLLNILSQRVNSTKKTTVSGDFHLNGLPFSAANFKKFAAYIMQEDVLMETLTPREILEFSATLRLPKSMSKQEKTKAVEQILEDLRLQNCADTRVGGIFIRGVSGGERKRVSIGMELITDPAVLFVDEPTSGLDSFTAEKVVQLLRELAQQGRTVITTIHQPSSEIFNLFDNLLLLSGGKVIYFGPANEAVEYFGNIGYPCPQYSNPADYFMKIMQPGSDEDNARLEKLIKAYEDSEKPPEPQESDNVAGLEKGDLDEVSKITELATLTKRAFKNFIRQPMMTKVRFMQNVFLGLITGALFYDVSMNQVGIQDRQGALFFVAINNGMTALMTTVLSFPPEKAIFLRETANNTYGIGSYYWGKTLAEFPFQAIFPLVNSVLAYYLVGLQNDAGKFLVFLITAILIALTCQSFGLLVGCLVADANVAVAITPMTVIPLMLFAGFFANSDSLPAPFQALQFISPFYYGFNAFALNEFSGLTLTCADDEGISFSCGAVTRDVCPITDGQQAIDKLNMFSEDIHTQILLLAVTAVCVRIIGFIALKLKTKSIY